MSVVELVEVKTTELVGAGLMWAAMNADGRNCRNPRKVEGAPGNKGVFDCDGKGIDSPALDLIHKHAVTLEPSDPWVEFGNGWQAMCITTRDDAPHSFHTQHGPDPLTAGLRAIVGAVSGETVLIPTVLME